LSFTGSKGPEDTLTGVALHFPMGNSHTRSKEDLPSYNWSPSSFSHLEVKIFVEDHLQSSTSYCWTLKYLVYDFAKFHQRCHVKWKAPAWVVMVHKPKQGNDTQGWAALAGTENVVLCSS
jgi:hypothetical protein